MYMYKRTLQSHRQTDPKTDHKQAKSAPFGGDVGRDRSAVSVRTVCYQVCRPDVSLLSGSRNCRGMIFQTWSKDPSPSFLSGIDRGLVGDWSGQFRDSEEHPECVGPEVGLNRDRFECQVESCPCRPSRLRIETDRLPNRGASTLHNYVKLTPTTNWWEPAWS